MLLTFVRQWSIPALVVLLDFLNSQIFFVFTNALQEALFGIVRLIRGGVRRNAMLLLLPHDIRET